MLWLLVLAGLVAVMIAPVSNRPSRLFVAAAMPALWLGAAYMLRRRRRLLIAAIAPGVLALGFLCAPGRDFDRGRLGALYLERLTSYEGTRYVWGGENHLGIDCSGLVRRALVSSELRLGLRTLNPRLCRMALVMWWRDSSALDLRDGRRGFTARRFEAPDLNSIAPARLAPGDIAVTADGVHTLAHLGQGLWIEADPDAQKVIRVQAPASNGWFTVPVVVLRWTALE